MPQYTISIQENPQADNVGVIVGVPIERLRVTVDATGALDHAAIIAAVQRTKRVYTKRAPKVST
jgi:hypothetical protein